jgi:hypothetical protein
MEGERLVCAAQAAYEMCLEHLYRFLCNVSSVVVWGDKLVLHVVAFDSFLELG